MDAVKSPDTSGRDRVIGEPPAGRLFSLRRVCSSFGALVCLAVLLTSSSLAAQGKRVSDDWDEDPAQPATGAARPDRDRNQPVAGERGRPPRVVPPPDGPPMGDNVGDPALGTGRDRRPRAGARDRNERTPAGDRDPRFEPAGRAVVPVTNSEVVEPLLHELPASLDDGRSINPALIHSVRDNTVGLQPEDRDAYFLILDYADRLSDRQVQRLALDYREERRRLEPALQARGTKEFPAFADLFMHPTAYRGRPVTLHGHLRKLTQFDPGDNLSGIGTVYEGWMYTADSQTNPAVIVFLDKPAGLPLGGDLTEEISVSGYFLKMYGYDAQDTLRRAPLILAGSVQWFPAKKKAEPFVVPTALYGLAFFVTIYALVLIWLRSFQPKPMVTSGLADQVAVRYGAPADYHPPANFDPLAEPPQTLSDMSQPGGYEPPVEYLPDLRTNYPPPPPPPSGLGPRVG